MILRKPYAFFIKFFRVFHIILTLISLYLLYRTNIILSFYNDYTSTVVGVIGQDLQGTLMYGVVLWLPIVSMLVLGIILFVLLFKKKPIMFYIFTLSSLIFLFVMLQIVNINLVTLSEQILDIRTVRLIRDFLFIAFWVNVVSTVVLFVRSVGFDIKKFGFGDDLNQLNISEADREEFEVDLKLDTNVSKRKFNYFLRKMKYAYQENKLFSILLISITLLVIIGVSLSFLITPNKEFKMNEYFALNGVSLKIENAYLIKDDYEGRIINEDYYYLILDVNLRGNLDIATALISIGSYSYTPTTNYNDKIIEFGEIYKNETDIVEYENRVLVYEIPKELVDRDITFKFTNKINPSKSNNLLVEIEYLKVFESELVVAKNLGEEINILNYYIKDYDIKIDSYQIEDYFKIPYEDCIDECYSFIKYIYPKPNRNYDEVVIRIDGTFEYEEMTIQKTYNLFNFIENFGVIEYTIDGVVKEFSDFTLLNSINGSIYVEVIDEIKNATNIKLIFNVKNEIYYYTLK